MYSARFHQNQWTYDPHGSDFNARVGRLLAGGQDLQATMKAKALDTLTSNIAFENNEKQSRGSVNMDAANAINQPSSSGRREPDGTGYVWVDEQGGYMGDLPQPDKLGGLTSTSASPHGTLNRTQATYASMGTVQRSMHMWRRVNAGCVESTMHWKEPTYKDHFSHNDKEADKPNKRHYMQKTEFSAYTEAKVKQGGPMVDR